MDPSCLITVKIRSFIPPDEPGIGFNPGKPSEIDVPAGITMEELINKYFSNNIDQIGIIALNGALASGETRLGTGDAIDLYPLLEGG